jgi:hypothetical protein
MAERWRFLGNRRFFLQHSAAAQLGRGAGGGKGAGEQSGKGEVWRIVAAHRQWTRRFCVDRRHTGPADPHCASVRFWATTRITRAMRCGDAERAADRHCSDMTYGRETRTVRPIRQAADF